MPILHCNARLVIGAIAVAIGVTLPSQAHGQIGKVDGRYVEPRFSVWCLFPHVDFHSICSNGICPSCKRRYCPLDALPNFGYSAPRWQAFPGTNPNYSPKKKDVGISTPTPFPTPTDPANTGALLIPTKPKATGSERPVAPVSAEAPPRLDEPVYAPIKPVIIPEIQPDDGDG